MDASQLNDLIPLGTEVSARVANQIINKGFVTNSLFIIGTLIVIACIAYGIYRVVSSEFDDKRDQAISVLILAGIELILVIVVLARLANIFQIWLWPDLYVIDQIADYVKHIRK